MSPRTARHNGCRGQLPRHDEVMVERKGVKCEVDHAIDRIFGRYKTTIDLTRRDCVERQNSSHRNKFPAREVALSAKPAR